MTAHDHQHGDRPKAAAVAGLLSLIGLAALSAAAAVGFRFSREPPPPERGGYEKRDAPPKLVVASLAGLLALVGVGALAAWAILAGYDGGHPAPLPTGFDKAASLPATPRLEVDQTRDRIALERQAEAHLTGYGWTNQAAGLAHIPIERAMALQAAEGWPDADTNAAPPPTSNEAESLPPDAGEAAASNTTVSQP
jgi:hypothetical protein